jgi:hypothetical protein
VSLAAKDIRVRVRTDVKNRHQSDNVEDWAGKSGKTLGHSFEDGSYAVSIDLYPYTLTFWEEELEVLDV